MDGLAKALSQGIGVTSLPTGRRKKEKAGKTRRREVDQNKNKRLRNQLLTDGAPHGKQTLRGCRDGGVVPLDE